jgi:hypothetical protein
MDINTQICEIAMLSPENKHRMKLFLSSFHHTGSKANVINNSTENFTLIGHIYTIDLPPEIPNIFGPRNCTLGLHLDQPCIHVNAIIQVELPF